jgi:tRNA-2-methylthio-N6-dimethylallyladenosine synthase
MREIDDLLRSGIKSITLLGQNVCAYGKDFGMASAGYGFPQLLADIRDRFARDGVWFKFLTSHPRDVSDDLINVIAGHPSFSRHFHLPLQAGDDEVLKRMARGYTSESFRALIRRICEKIPDMRLTTDLIVGFPGEDEPAFERTLEMVREIGFDAAFTFLYSPRAETPAEEWADPVPLEEKKRRLQALIEIQNGITLERASRKVGSDALVLVEAPATGTASRGSEMVAGRTREDEVVVLPGGPSDFGRMVKVKLTRARQRSFLAERLDEVPGDESSEAF